MAFSQFDLRMHYQKFQAIEKVREERNLIDNGWLQATTENGLAPAGFALVGDATYGVPGGESHRIGRGVRLLA